MNAFETSRRRCHPIGACLTEPGRTRSDASELSTVKPACLVYAHETRPELARRRLVRSCAKPDGPDAWLRDRHRHTQHSDGPNLAAYVAHGEARPAFKRAFTARLALFTGGAPTG